MATRSMENTIELATSYATDKAMRPAKSTFVAAILAGFFIAIGGAFAVLTSAGTGQIAPYGYTKVFMGVTFSLGLILVVMSKAELFTGNMSLVLPLVDRRISFKTLSINWILVFAGNFVGSILLAAMIVFSRQYEFGNGEVGTAMLKVAHAKMANGWLATVILAILCNVLVSAAVFLALVGDNMAEKIIGIVFAVSAFVALGFEHCVANMYLISSAIFIELSNHAFVNAHFANHGEIGIVNFAFNNLFPATIGNIIGGVIFWLAYKVMIQTAENKFEPIEITKQKL